VKRSELAALCCGFGLLLLSVFVGLSIVSWDTQDPQVLANYEDAPRTIRNRCGTGGALVASFLLRAHGVGAFLVPFCLLGLGLHFVRKRSLETGLRRAGGALILVLGVSLLAGTLAKGWLASVMASCSVEGPGGSFGGQPVVALTRLLGGVGTQLVILFMLGAGALLASRGVVEKILSVLGKGCLKIGPLLSYVARASVGKLPGRFTNRSTQEVLRTLPPLAQKVSAATAALPRISFRDERDDPATERIIPDESTVPEQHPPVPSVRVAASVRKAAPVKPIEEVVSERRRRARPRTLQTIADVTTRRLLKKEGEAESQPAGGYRLPPVDVLIREDARSEVNKDELAQRGVQIVNTFSEFGIDTRLVSYEPGPALTLYEFELAPGIRLNKVIGLADNLAMAVMSPNVRVIAPLPGKSTIGVEVPNLRTDMVRMRPVLEADSDADREARVIPLIFGRDAAGRPLVSDLAAMPHLLVAGASGSGKSVCMHAMISSILMQKRPDQVRLILVDPKMVEFMRYRGIPHLACPVVTEVKRAAGVLDWAVREMQSRYELLSAVGARDIGSYNRLSPAARKKQASDADDPERFESAMPYIVIMVDELSDLMMVASKEVEYSITRLAQKSRATGIHLVLATQRPSVDVVTGLIKSNISCRIAFHVTARIDSSVILDRPGAEKLLGQGDMLFLSPGYPTPVRAKGVYLSDEEIARIVQHTRAQDVPADDLPLVAPPEDNGPGGNTLVQATTVDALYHEAIRIVLTTKRGSVSLLQRRLGIGYTRAGKLIDMMAADGILGPYRGSKSRDIKMTLEEWEASIGAQRKSA